MKKRNVILLAVLCLLILSGCGGAPEQGTPREQAASAARDDVIIAFDGIPTHFDPLRGFGADGQLIFSTLVETDSGMNVVGDLAAEYTVSDDALTYTFSLRQDARFTDGEPVKASDVVFSCNAIKENATSIDLSVMAGCEAADEQTVIFHLYEPQSVFILTLTQIGIVPEHLYGDDFALNPVGSGPFKLAQYDVDQQFILEANEDYYREVPAMKKVVFLNMGDEDTRYIAAQSGQADIAATSATIAANGGVSGYYLLNKATVDNMGISMPVLPDEGDATEDGYPIGNDVTSDIAIRKALAYGIDRQAICDDALGGFASPAYSENDGMPWWNPETAIETDIAYAEGLLDAAGWVDADSDGIREKGGLRASFTLMYFAGDSVRQAVAMSAANQARALGIEIAVEGVAATDIMPRMFSEPLILAWGSSNPRTSYMLFHSSNAGRTDWYNPENFRNGAVDGYLDAAMAASGLEASIPWWRLAQWDGETGASMRGEAPYIFLINKNHLYWAREGLDTGEQKIHAHGDGWPLVANLREWTWN